MAVLERDKKISAVALSALVAWFALTCSCVGSKTSRIMPPDVAGKLYIAEYGRVDDINVRIVSGQYVRENLDEEFTNFGQHYRFRFIPVNEFWLDQQNAPGEESFFVRHLLIEHKLMAQGMNYEKALERADAAELAERSKTKPALEGEALLKSGRTAELMGRIHKQFLEEYGTDVKVWVVDGELVRNLCFIDFTEGGHDKVYRFVPEKEVWLDDDLMPEERRLVLLHEMHERYLMAHGWPYSKAHKDSRSLNLAAGAIPGNWTRA